MTVGSYIRNPELKSILLKLILAQMVLACLFFGATQYELRQLGNELTVRNIALAGQILSRYPELENEVVGLVTKQATAQEIAIGKKILAAYGYESNLPVFSQPLLKDYYAAMPFEAAILAFIFILPLAMLVYREYAKIYKKIGEISLAAESVVDGDFSIVLPQDREGEFGILGHNFNVMASRLKHSLERLREEKVFLNHIISDISHQLKTPLSSLMAMNELMLAGRVAKANNIEFLDKCKSQLHRMEWLITNLLKIARLEAGSIHFRSERKLLAHVLEKSLSPLQISVKQKRQRVSMTGNVDGVYFTGDEGWTVEALTNILKNCIEHTGVGGEIHIEFAETPLFSRVIILDNGEGIDKKDLPHIFERFYKGSSSVKSASVGIGLALAKIIIESQNGSILVTSEKGQGTRFVVTFFVL